MLLKFHKDKVGGVLMNLQFIKAVFFIFGSYIISIPAGAAIYSITFYEQISGGTNLFANYQVSSTATFEINNSAIGPDSLVLFTSPDFVAFDAILNTTAGDARFTLGVDDFPPKGDGTIRPAHEQGILFDAVGQPLRFDNPETTYGNGAQICDPRCDIRVGLKTTLVLLDDNGFDRVFLGDGTIISLGNATNNGLDYTRLGGKWNLGGATITVGGTGGLYQLQAVPIPAAMWLFGSGLIGLIGIARRKG